MAIPLHPPSSPGRGHGPRPRTPRSPVRGQARLLLAGLLTLGALPLAGAAQTPPSVLDFIPSEGTLRLPDVGSATLANGSFSGVEPVLPQGTPVRAWSFEGRAGDRVSVTLRARDFDALVLVVGPGLAGGLSDDDGAGGTDSRLCLTLAENGTYRAVASAFEAAQGAFELALARVDEASEALCPVSEEQRLWEGPVAGTLATGETVDGRLDPDQPDAGDIWQLEAPAGQAVTLILHSTEFDGYLDVGGPGAPGEVYADDDSGGACDARVELVVRSGSSYQVRVTTATGGGGAYQLTATAAPPPPSDAPCGGVGGGFLDAGAEDEASGLVDVAARTPPARVLRVGQERTGTLASTDLGFLDGTPAHVWKVEGLTPGVLRVEVLSDEFDPYLYLFAGTDRVRYQDDDGAGGLAAGISVPVTSIEDEVWIVLRPVGADGVGSYRVRALISEGG